MQLKNKLLGCSICLSLWGRCLYSIWHFKKIWFYLFLSCKSKKKIPSFQHIETTLNYWKHEHLKNRQRWNDVQGPVPWKLECLFPLTGMISRRHSQEQKRLFSLRVRWEITPWFVNSSWQRITLGSYRLHLGISLLWRIGNPRHQRSIAMPLIGGCSLDAVPWS